MERGQRTSLRTDPEQVLRIVRAPDRVFLDLRGTVRLELRLASG